MANTQVAFGFRHIGYLPGGAPDYQQLPVAIQSSYATKIGFGDPVIKAASGSSYIIQATGSLATASPIWGIFVGCTYVPTGGYQSWSNYWAAPSCTVDATGYVISAPNALFLAATLQTAITTANIGQGVNFTTTTPNTAGISAAVLDQGTLATAASGTAVIASPFKVFSMYQGVGNGSDPTTNYNWVVVTFNNEIYKSLGGF